MRPARLSASGWLSSASIHVQPLATADKPSPAPAKRKHQDEKEKQPCWLKTLCHTLILESPNPSERHLSRCLECWNGGRYLNANSTWLSSVIQSVERRDAFSDGRGPYQAISVCFQGML